jgi:predicted nucleic acid-binding protein
VKVWLADTGPLVALLAADESSHAWSSEQAKAAPTTVLTCDAVITESLFLLKRARHDQGKLFALIESGFLRSDFDLHTEHRAVRTLMRRYADTPMSFADACLVRMSEIHSPSVVWTLDRDFSVYRQHGRQTIPLITPH